MSDYTTSTATLRRRRWVSCLGLAVMLLATVVHAQIVGDLNGDGRIDILDIQGATNMALGSTASTSQADVDLSTAVNVLDVQVLTNTALGTGGLVQPVVGTVSGGKASGSLKVIAVSTDGRKLEAEANAQTGAFELLLPVRTSWSLSFKSNSSNTVTTLAYPLAGDIVWALPLKSLCNGNTINLGALSVSSGIATTNDLRTLLAERSEPLETEDHDDDGWLDLFQSLVLPYPWTVPGSGIVLPAGLDISDLQDALRDCTEDSLEHIAAPDLTGIEGDGVPAFAVPLLDCFRSELVDWLGDGEDNGPSPAQIEALANQIMDVLTARIIPWVQGLDRPELIDLDGNGIPDYIESDLCREFENENEVEGEVDDLKKGGNPDNCELDDDGNGRPDYAEDEDNDGLPNYLDEDAYTNLDSDGDGIPNSIDLDDDNDGILDYADHHPLDPSED